MKVEVSNSGLGNNFSIGSLYLALSKNWLDSLQTLRMAKA